MVQAHHYAVPSRHYLHDCHRAHRAHETGQRSSEYRTGTESTLFEGLLRRSRPQFTSRQLSQHPFTDRSEACATHLQSARHSMNLVPWSFSLRPNAHPQSMKPRTAWGQTMTTMFRMERETLASARPRTHLTRRGARRGLPCRSPGLRLLDHLEEVVLADDLGLVLHGVLVLAEAVRGKRGVRAPASDTGNGADGRPATDEVKTRTLGERFPSAMYQSATRGDR